MALWRSLEYDFPPEFVVETLSLNQVSGAERWGHLLSCACQALPDFDGAPGLPTSPSNQPQRLLETLLQEAQVYGDIAYLQFQAAEVTETDVRLTLEARIAVGDPKRQGLGLSSISVKFVKIAAEWKVVDEPVYSAV